MSKELEYFQEIIKVDEEALTLANKEKSKKRDVMLHRQWLNKRKISIEAALKEYQEINIKYKLAIEFIDNVADVFDEHNLEELADKIVKVKKALEVIRNKGVFVHLLQQSQNAKVYNSLMIMAFKKMAEKDYEGVVKKFCLTQEEYELLKEVLL